MVELLQSKAWKVLYVDYTYINLQLQAGGERVDQEEKQS